MTDTAAANRAALKRGYEAFQTGNMDVLRDELFAPDIIWHSPGRNQLSGDFRGVDAVLALFVKQFELTDGTFRVEVHDFLGSDEHAVAIASVSAERDGKSMTDQYVHVCHFRDGRLTEAWILNFDPNKADELFA
jgi:ketosteroid isomerase-like protein